MKKVIPVIIGVGVLFIVIWGMMKLSEPSVDKIIEQMSLELNAQLPMMVDGEKRWDSVTPGESKSFTYNYTLIKADVAKLNPGEMRVFLKPVVKSKVASITELRKLLDKGVTITYTYNDKNGRLITSFDLTAEDYKKSKPVD